MVRNREKKKALEDEQLKCELRSHTGLEPLTVLAGVSGPLRWTFAAKLADQIDTSATVSARCIGTFVDIWK